MKRKLIILLAGSIFVFGLFILPTAARAEIPEEHLCLNYWWRDATHPNCSLKEFCGGGGNIPTGVLTFETKASCQAGTTNQSSPVISKDVLVSWPKRILLQVQEFFANILVRLFPSFQSGRQGVPPKEVPTGEQSIYNCGGFMGTQCPAGYKCKILGGDIGTCVR